MMEFLESLKNVRKLPGVEIFLEQMILWSLKLPFAKTTTRDVKIFNERNEKGLSCKMAMKRSLILKMSLFSLFLSNFRIKTEFMPLLWRTFDKGAIWLINNKKWLTKSSRKKKIGKGDCSKDIDNLNFNFIFTWNFVAVSRALTIKYFWNSATIDFFSFASTLIDFVRHNEQDLIKFYESKIYNFEQTPNFENCTVCFELFQNLLKYFSKVRTCMNIGYLSTP